MHAPLQPVAPNGQAVGQNSTLLRKLLDKEIRVERSHLLQAFRFLEKNGCAGAKLHASAVRKSHVHTRRAQVLARTSTGMNGITFHATFLFAQSHSSRSEQGNIHHAPSGASWMDIVKGGGF